MAGARGCSNQMVLALITWMLYSSSSSSAQKDCTNEFSELLPCLDFVTDKAPTPPADCCTSISSILNTTPDCLCQVGAPGGPGDAFPDLNRTRLEQTPTLCNVPFNPAICQAGGAPPPTPTSSSLQLVSVSKLLILLTSAAAMLL